MLGILGLGLRGYNSITVEEKLFIENSDRVFIDSYTSVLFPEVAGTIEKNTGKMVEPVGRGQLESNDFLFGLASSSNVSLLVSGDPFMATTHNEIRYQCARRGIEARIFENASILNSSVGYTGISPYRVGAPVSLPRVSEKFFPLSVYRKIAKNIEERRHTILLLDTADGKPMNVPEAIDTLLMMEEKEKGGYLTQESEIIAVSALGTDNSSMVFGTLGRIRNMEISTVPSTIIILSELDENERTYVGTFCLRA